jgi:hypothetical protein
LTDEIKLEDLPQLGGRRVSPKGQSILLSNGTLVFNFDHTTLPLPSDNLFDILIGKPIDTRRLQKYPGEVYIIRLLPEGGCKLEDIIVRDRDLWGRVRFRSKLSK